MKDMTVQELHDLGKMMAQYALNDLGYTSANLDVVRIYPDSSVEISLHTHDDFQDKLGYEHRIQHPTSYVSGGTVGKMWEQLQARPKRAERELAVLLKVNEPLREKEHLFKAELTRDEVRKSIERLDELKSHILPAPVNNDDEIPF